MRKLRISRNLKELVLGYFDKRWQFPAAIYYSSHAEELRQLFPSFLDFVAVVEALADEGLLERGDGYFKYAYRRPLGRGGEERG